MDIDRKSSNGKLNVREGAKKITIFWYGRIFLGAIEIKRDGPAKERISHYITLLNSSMVKF